MAVFPVLQKGNKVFVDIKYLNEDWAIKNHGQTLIRLAERGGLSPEEIVCNVNRLKPSEIRNITPDYASDIIDKIKVNNA